MATRRKVNNLHFLSFPLPIDHPITYNTNSPRTLLHPVLNKTKSINLKQKTIVLGC